VYFLIWAKVNFKKFSFFVYWHTAGVRLAGNGEDNPWRILRTWTPWAF
jgi:hypothetical protein